MNKYLAALAAVIGLLASGFTAASAGLVLTETETMVSGQQPGIPSQPPRERTMMIQGDKQKTVIEGGRSIITDIDKGTTVVLDPTHKSYFERPFPPAGMAGKARMEAAAFTKTGKMRTVSGYKCEDYNGSGKFQMGDFTVVSCISTSAPGAAEFTKFQKAMTAKLKDTQLAMPNMPDGVPIEQNTTTKMSIANMPNLPPQTLAALKKQFANRPPVVTKTEVTKIESRTIAASEFEIPAGFTKQEPVMAHPPGMGMSGPGAGAGHMMGGPGASSPAGGGSSGGGSPPPLMVAPPAAKP